jgi:SAM-dependent methyltransferase
MLNYKEKLQQFNSTDKYKGELNMLRHLVDPKRGQKIIDYGCGLGTAMKHLHNNSEAEIYGYDITKEYYDWDDFYFREMIYFKVDTVYFMHSFAHIHYLPLQKIKDQFLNDGGKIVVITPNRLWLDLQNKKDYKPDPTVFKHYTISELIKTVTDYGFKVESCGQFGQVTDNIHERLFIVATL